jgi:CDP-paratose 2-epimerase
MNETHLVIGGAGFIGSNLVSRLIGQGQKVIIFDNLSRKGSEKNLDWLNSLGGNIEFVNGDVTKDLDKLSEVVKKSGSIYHLAAQVAVTSSVLDPRHDFEVNALGSFNVLESVRLNNPNAKVLYSSTNKVYGGMEEVKVLEKDTRYEYADFPNGMSELQPLDFHSPYGCSKGTGDQYFRDYARIYNLNTVVFRQSCIYGPRQFGVEDQGWLAWFLIALHTGKKISIYGDGKQVRDVLFIDDLLDAYQLAFKNINEVKGQVFNIGGGAKNTISVLYEFKPILEELLGKEVIPDFGEWRAGDQRIYVSDITKAKNAFGWEPKFSPKDGITKLNQWVSENLSLFVD